GLPAGGYAAIAVCGWPVPDRVRRLRPAERDRYEPRTAGDDPRLPAGGKSRRPRVLAPDESPVAEAVFVVLPPRPAAHRPARLAQPARGVQLPPRFGRRISIRRTTGGADERLRAGDGHLHPADVRDCNAV